MFAGGNATYAAIRLTLGDLTLRATPRQRLGATTEWRKRLPIHDKLARKANAEAFERTYPGVHSAVTATAHRRRPVAAASPAGP